MKNRFFLGASAFLGLFYCVDAKAAGTALDVQGGRATGMAGATTAFIDDASAIYFNPAGMANGKGLDAQAGINLIVPSFSYKSAASGKKTTMPFSVVTPFQLYASYGITENVSAGVGFFTPFGLDLQWPDKWEGRSQITKASLRTYVINPTIAVRFLDNRIKLGAGLQIMRGTVELERDLNFGTSYGHVDLGGGSWGVGANGGVQIEAIKKYLLAGVTYRSAVHLNFDDGRAHFSNIPAAFQNQVFDGPVTTGLNQPDQIAMALATHPVDNLVLDAEVVWLGWGKFHSVDVNFPNNQSLSSHEPKNWDNRVNVHVGGEYTINPNWQVRAGAMYDPSPSPSNTLGPDIPDANRLNLALGATYKHDSGAFVDLGYQFITLFSKTSSNPNYPGEAGGLVNILAVSVGFTQNRAPASSPPPPAPPPEEPAPGSNPPPSEPAPAPANP
jgi:long-chain fatty acid transport protein